MNIKSNRTISRRNTSVASADRRGSVLVVVLALLAALMLLGFLFFTIASQERENARYFTASEKFYAAQLSPDELFDFAMEQVIVGPQDDLANSALWGGRYSLLAGLVGDDLQPYSGRGVTLVQGTSAGEPAVDQNQDGTADGAGTELYTDGINDQLTLHLGDFVGAIPSGSGIVNLRGLFEKPDVSYSYPDLNSPFLSYIGKEPVTGNTVMVPSFHRPQYLRGLIYPLPTPAVVPEDQWYTDDRTRPYMLRPHATRPVRVFNYGTGEIETATVGGTPVERFVGGAGGPYFTADDNGDGILEAANPKEGFWDWDESTTATGGPNTPHIYDADPDDDGIADASYMDLDHPIEETPDGTTKFIPLFAITIYDLDALLNLNAHGNVYGDLSPTNLALMPDGAGPSPFQLLSRSNESRHKSEINSQYGMLSGPAGTLPPAGADTTQIQNFFEDPVDSEIELANREWWFVLAGRGQLDGPLSTGGKPTQLFPGRWGEADMLNTALQGGLKNPYAYPRPGKANSDEGAGVGDGNRGLGFLDYVGQLFPNSLRFQAPLNPEDHYGRGTFVAGDGKTPLINLPNAGLAPEQALARGTLRVIFPLYQQYWVPPIALGAAQAWVDPLWTYAFGSFPPAAPNGGLVTAAVAGLFAPSGYYVDDPGETLIDPDLARNQITDSIFRADETAYLFASDSDVTSNGLVSRLLNLVPANFGSASDRAERRRRFTTVSSDPKAYSYSTPVSALRSWEVEAYDPANPNLATFPPRFLPPLTGGGFDPSEPFRQEARGLLASIPNPTAGGQTLLKQLTRKLSANHVAAAYPGGDGVPRYLLRPLTPHPLSGLTEAVVPFPPSVTTFAVPDVSLPAAWRTNAITTAAQQEWHARRDRQNMARDIYVLLYTLGNPDPAVDVTSTSGAYTTAQLVEMAQFAVNVVDAMDPDDTITCFTFDLDLSTTGGGWDINDDGYTTPIAPMDLDPAVDADGDTDTANDLFHYVAGERGIVYGVELQQLAFSEAMAVLTKTFIDGGSRIDHAATEWDDSNPRDFTFVELQNMTPGAVPLAGGWSIVCSPTDVDGGAIPTARAFTPVDATEAVPRGGLYTIGAAGDGSNVDRGTDPGDPSITRPIYTSGVQVLPSRFAIDMDVTDKSTHPTSFGDYEQFAPAVLAANPKTPAVNFDLIYREKDEPLTVRINDVVSGNVSRDATEQTTDPQDGVGPKGGAWLDLGAVTDRDSITTGEVTFYLRRRLNLHRAIPPQDDSMLDQNQQNDNPWVIVDKITVPLSVFDPNGANAGADFQSQNKLAAVKSEERPEALQENRQVSLRTLPPQYDGNPATVPYDQFNNLGVPNIDASGNPLPQMTVWQRHFDRSFASMADVLTVPLYGPRVLTQASPGFAPVVSDPRQTAAVNFLFPEVDHRPLASSIVSPPYPPGAFAPGALAQVFPAGTGNLWYRMLEFVEIPSKYGDQDSLPWFAHYGGPTGWLSDPSQRQPWLRERLRLRDFGRLNLNTMRHPQALAGLLDDPRVLSFQNASPNAPAAASPFASVFNPVPGGVGVLPSAGTNGTSGSNGETWLGGSSGGRDWWLAILASRDGGLDRYAADTARSGYSTVHRFVLPGTPTANPFREFGSAPLDASLTLDDFESTLLRTMPAIGSGYVEGFETAVDRRGLFELGEPGSVLGSDAEFSSRYRLLGKVLNHGTTRSNTYVAFIQTDFFEATDPVDHDSDPNTAPISQIGAKLADSPGYRGVFVIDRSLALELLKRSDLPPLDPRLVYPQGSQYRTYSFAREQGSDGRPAPTFDWKELILYRRVLDAQ